MQKQIFINKFEKGSKENANLGQANLVGIDTYSKKGVAILAKRSTIVTTGFTGIPHFFEQTQLGIYIWAYCSDGSVVYSSNGGTSWTNINDATFPIANGNGNGMIYFQGYIFCFSTTKIFYHSADPTSGGWTDWTTAKTLGSLQNFGTNPISGLHFPFLYPNSRGVYFGNGGDGGTSNASSGTCSVGFFGQNGTTAFNPAGTLGTDFLYNNGILILPSLTYNINSIDFLPPSNLAISLTSYQNPSQGSDLITWDTISSNKFSPPLRIYSNSLSDTTSTAGIKQLYNRNQVLYAVSGGNHTVYETNGSSFNLLEDIGLYSNVRSYNGGELDYPVYFNSYPQGICVLGNKLLTAVSTLTNTAVYPPNSLSTTGLFPIGVWSIAFAKDGSHSTQCEFIFPTGFTPGGNVSPAQTNSYLKLTAVRPIAQVSNSTSQLIIGFGYNSVVSGQTSNGVILVDLYSYITGRGFTAIESELFEIGTALKPETVNNIEINLGKKLLAGQTIDISYRTSLDQDWTLLDTYVGDGTKNYYSLNKNPIGATQFIQLQARMETGSPNVTSTPELRSIILS